MNPALKYALGRVGLFVLVAIPLILLLPGVNLLIRLMAAVLISALLSFFLLRGVRAELEQHLLGVAERRREEKERLRAAIAGEDQPKATDADGV